MEKIRIIIIGIPASFNDTALLEYRKMMQQPEKGIFVVRNSVDEWGIVTGDKNDRCYNGQIK